MKYFIGLLSGTSVDNIDAALVGIGENDIRLIETHSHEFSSDLRHQLQQLIKNQSITLVEYSQIDSQLAHEFSDAVIQLLKKTHFEAKQITAIGSHGQTIFHEPNGDYRNTIQIGSPHQIAARCGIDVVSNFRNLDMAYKGQGAPLAPVIHQKLFHSETKNYAILNLGGIANISFIGKNYPQPSGYDTGPANCLLDEWILKNKGEKYDANGQWAETGELDKNLLNQLIGDRYFNLQAPKSTGREYFNLTWLSGFENSLWKCPAANVQNTLTHLTALSISNEIKKSRFPVDEVVVMGGGSKNKFLLELLGMYSQIPVHLSEDFGFDGDWIESILFAYLAYLRVNQIKLDLSSITGSQNRLLYGDLIRC